MIYVYRIYAMYVLFIHGWLILLYNIRPKSESYNCFVGHKCISNLNYI